MFSEKPIVAFTNSAVILDLYIIYKTKPFWSHVIFTLIAWTLKKVHHSQFPGSLSPYYKYQHERQIPQQLSFPQTIPDYIRYIIGVFCCNL